jgi:hypothetical protein
VGEDGRIRAAALRAHDENRAQSRAA